MVRVAVVGGINVDVFALVDRHPDGDHPSLIDRVAEGPGGKGANQAVAAARLGASVRLLGAIGADDDGERVVAALRARGVDCDGVRMIDDAPTGRVVGTVTADGEKRTSALGGANLRLSVRDVERFEGAIVGADVVLVQLEPPAPVVRAVLEIAAGAEVPTLLDIAPAQGPVRDLFPLATWVCANRSEIEAATGIAVHDEATAREAATIVRAHGPEICGVTVGGAGQLVAWPGGEVWCEPDRSVEIVDTAGAGDAFAATLGVLLAQGERPRDAAQRASAASTIACAQLGAMQ